MRAKHAFLVTSILICTFLFGCASQTTTKSEPEIIPTSNTITYEGSGWTMDVQDCWNVEHHEEYDATSADLTKEIRLFISEQSGAGIAFNTVDLRTSMLETMFEDEDDKKFKNVSKPSSTIMTGEYVDSEKPEYGYSASFWAGTTLVNVALYADSESAYNANRQTIEKVIDSINISNSTSSATTNSQSNNSNKTNSTTSSSSSSAYKAGSYRVGVDIPAGEYLAKETNDSIAMFSVYPSVSDKSTIILQHVFSNQCYFRGFGSLCDKGLA